MSQNPLPVKPGHSPPVAVAEAGSDTLLRALYDELRRLAAGFLAGQRPGHTLQPTALVHEAYLKLARGRESDWKDREHFLAVAATAMRQILMNHARERRAVRRGGPDRQQITLDEVVTPARGPAIDLFALHGVLTKLEAIDPRQAKVVELRFFGGLGVDEVARVLEVSPRTVELDWRMAKARLKLWLEDSDSA